MNKLLLLRGAARSGKTTLIHDLGLESYALSADVIRLQMQSPFLNTNGTYSISQKNDSKVWDYLFNCLEVRMQRGEFTVVDATHSRSDMFSRYKKLVDKYRYRAYVLTIDLDVEEVLARNLASPELNRVPEDVIRNMVARIKTQEPPKWVTRVTKENVFEYLSPILIDSNNFDKIFHIGDIHGCSTALNQILDQVTERDLVIFLGDYFDRGIENVDVFNTLMTWVPRKNAVFIQGNHEKGLEQWAFESEVIKRGFQRTSIEFEEAEISKSDARVLYRILTPMSFYTFRGQKVFVNHGCIPVPPSFKISSTFMIQGTGKYEHLPEVYEAWKKDLSHNIIQVHGHRNEQNYPTIMLDDNLINLCGTAEFGGKLRVVVLDNNGWKEISVQNPIYNIRLTETPIVPTASSNDVVQSLRANKYVREMYQFGNISSFNYTSAAFWDRQWDNDTIKARGLYLRVTDGAVVARGYKKFFAEGEHPSSSIKELSKNLVYPVKAYVKENGFLGIVGYDDETDTVIIGTKGGVSNDYAAVFSKMLPDAAREYVKLHKVSLTLEVIDPIFDPHIIEYDHAEIVLLDIIDNNIEFSKRSHQEVVDLAIHLGVRSKVEVNTFYEWKEISDFLKIQEEFRDNDIEGYVLVDSSGFMFRVKTKYYKYWKHMRGVLETVKRNRPVRLATLSSERHTLDYAKMMANKDQLTNIIAYRHL